MNETAEIAIVGGGVVGASVAFHLAERGCTDVVVLERETALGLGSTGKATGGIRAQFATDINVKLSLYAMRFLSEWDVDCGYDPRGYLFVASGDDQMQQLAAAAALQRAAGYTDLRLVDKREIGEMVPGLDTTSVVGGSFGPRDGFLDPIAILNGFAGQAATAGVEFRTGVEVLSLSVAGGRVTGVELAGGRIDCDSVVLCTGAWAAELAATAGVRLPVVPERRQIVWARMPEPLPPRTPMVVDVASGFHFRPARDTDNEVLMACPDTAPPCSSTDFNDAFIDEVRVHARRFAPMLDGAAVLRDKCRAGLYENSPDHHAIIGGCGIDGLYIAAGFSGHGVMHSPATGRAVAEIMLDGEATFIDVSPLSIDRFGRGELLTEAGYL